MEKSPTQADIDFLAAWRRTFGNKPVRVRELLPLALAAGQPVPSGHAARVWVGLWLGARRGATIHTSAGSFRITAAGVRTGYQRWALTEPPSTTDNSKENE